MWERMCATAKGGKFMMGSKKRKITTTYAQDTRQPRECEPYAHEKREDTARKKKRFSFPAVAVQTLPVVARSAPVGNSHVPDARQNDGSRIFKTRRQCSWPSVNQWVHNMSHNAINARLTCSSARVIIRVNLEHDRILPFFGVGNDFSQWSVHGLMITDLSQTLLSANIIKAVQLVLTLFEVENAARASIRVVRVNHSVHAQRKMSMDRESAAVIDMQLLKFAVVYKTDFRSCANFVVSK
ncbi:uncharacterized protein BJ212DRAFT_1299362 [Suillus subaureus]|uniref:Uncharacterized protein n=1 Tax=Suillus subaureus TaxID=48587 RepID=A0A9P7ECI7_9AGAM|nr:uncharacterized protein BJ212DRAFT_1299362 [Suillus subaureus]KAG1817208.1 hypothetical protein BJ212DRAFT_1299362 [Suillus subaureus]